MSCIFKGNCPVENRIGCTCPCTVKEEIDFLLYNSNIPNSLIGKNKLHPEDIDLKTFEILNDIKVDSKNFVKDGRFLYLWSHNSGNGKTTWAVKILQTYFAYICIGNLLTGRGWFEYIPSFILLSKDFNNDERKLHLNKLLTMDLVILDDFGCVNNSNYDITVLSSIIDTRKANGLATIITSNLNVTELEKVVGVRIADRCGSDIVLEFKGASRRVSTATYKRKEDNR